MRTSSTTITAAAAIVVLLFASSAFGQAGQQTAAAKSGSGLYVNYCGSCHGPNAKGDGPMAAALTKKPADLTLIAKRNGGEYPTDLVFRTIDGRNPVLGHGGQEMPIWGNAFLRAEGGATVEQARARVDALVAYLATIQQK
jgi:mono/diheme cytochrome c family protein